MFLLLKNGKTCKVLLRKIKYENYLELQKEILAHICMDNEFYGINLYRLEKELRPYIQTNEVNQLLTCDTFADENAILTKAEILYDICFPKVYGDFASLSYYSDIEMCSKQFCILSNQIILINSLIIDELVERNYLGDDWCDFLHETINELAKKVLYNPKDINYTITPKSQEAFEKVLSTTTKNYLIQTTGLNLT